MSKNISKSRDSFASKWGFIVSCIGSAVGMGNIWLFPTRVSKYGGGTFLLPYFICVALLGLTGVVGEMSFGRAMRGGPTKAFGAALKQRNMEEGFGKALGFIPILSSLALAIGYAVVVGWIFKYAFSSISGRLMLPQNVDEYGEYFGKMATGFGNSFWQITGLIACFLIMIFGVSKGIERANKILMPLFFLLFLGLAVYISFQSGANAGYQYIFTIDIKGLADPLIWVFALGQAFFSLSLAGSGTLIYGSYLSDEVNVVASAFTVAFFDTVAAILASLVIIPAMATTGAKLDMGGPGLMFVFLPHLFKGINGSRILVIIFFISVLFAALTSLINLFETPIAALEELFEIKRWQAVAVIGTFGSMISICIQGIISSWMDFVSIYLCPLGAALSGIMFFWVCKNDFVRNEINKNRNIKTTGIVFTFLSKYVFCGITILVLILGIVFKGIG